MQNEAGHINPKIFQLDDHKKCLLMVLFKLYQGCTKKEFKIYTVQEIATHLAQHFPKGRKNIFDTKELYRLLYILEGWELCCPVPETKLTSQKWRLTQKGFEMVLNVKKSLEKNLESVF